MENFEQLTFSQIQETFLTQKAFLDKISPLFDLYYDAIIRPQEHKHKYSWDECTFDYADDSGFWINYQYNDSCGCHPEYTEGSFLLPWEFINQFINDPEGTKAKLEEQKQEALRKEAEKKQEKERKEKEALEAIERKKFEELKKKFGE